MIARTLSGAVVVLVVAASLLLLVACKVDGHYTNIDGGDSIDAADDATAEHDAVPIDAYVPPDADTRTWSLPALVENVNGTGNETMPSISADRLELYFTRPSTSPPYGEIYVARRASTAVAFSAPTAVTQINTAGNEQWAVIAESGLEIFVSTAGPITRYTRSSPAASWGSGTSTGISGSFASLAGGGLTMYLIGSCPADQYNGTGPCLYRSTRPSTSGAWSAREFTPWPSDLQWNGISMSDDETRFLVSNPYAGSSARVALFERNSVDDPWGSIEIIDELSLEITNKDARLNWTYDEIYLAGDPIGTGVGGFDIYLSVLE